MKKYILRIFLFFGIVIAFDFGFGKACELLQSYARGGRLKNVWQTAMNQEANVVIMGSSRAHHHYVPLVFEEELKMTAHNAGVDGNGIVLATGLYELMSNRYTPKIIVYDVSLGFDIYMNPKDGNNIRYVGWLRPYFFDKQVQQLLARVDPSERYKNISYMFRYNSKIMDLLKDQVVISDYTVDGFAPLKGLMKENIIHTDDMEFSQIDTLKIKLMEEFIARISSSDTRLIMIASPLYGVKSSEVFKPIKDICQRYGVDFMDYYASPEFQKKQFFNDQSHLNEEGAKVFSKALASKLQQVNSK